MADRIREISLLQYEDDIEAAVRSELARAVAAAVDAEVET